MLSQYQRSRFLYQCLARQMRHQELFLIAIVISPSPVLVNDSAPNLSSLIDFQCQILAHVLPFKSVTALVFIPILFPILYPFLPSRSVVNVNVYVNVVAIPFCCSAVKIFSSCLMSLPHVWLTFTSPQKQAVTPLLQHLILILGLKYLQLTYQRFSSPCFGLCSSVPNAANVMFHSLRHIGPLAKSKYLNVPMWQTSVPNAATFECSLIALVESIPHLASQCNVNVSQRANVATQRAKCGNFRMFSHRSRQIDSSPCKPMQCQCISTCQCGKSACQMRQTITSMDLGAQRSI
jgi:hypothetical protein